MAVRTRVPGVRTERRAVFFGVPVVRKAVSGVFSGQPGVPIIRLVVFLVVPAVFFSGLAVFFAVSGVRKARSGVRIGKTGG